MAGPLLPECLRQTGLPPDCNVRVGIHDSNASFLRHRMTRPLPFAVASTGTWVVCMAAGAVTGDAGGPQLPCQCRCAGHAGACCNFMGGREFPRLTKGLHGCITTLEDVAAVVEQGSMLVPPLGDDGGPFDGDPLGGPGGAPTQTDEQARGAAPASIWRS